MLNADRRYTFELGFATFYMNRTNRSGIIKGGVIGGLQQNGNWKLDARFNKDNLIKRISKIVESEGWNSYIQQRCILPYKKLFA